MRPLGPNRLTALVAGLALVASYGCSPLPSAPVLTAGSSSPGAGAPGVVSIAPDAKNPGQGPNPAPGPPAFAMTARADSVEMPVNGHVGGHMELGRVALDVPPGAYKGLGQVKILLPDSLERGCALTVTPSQRNHFDVPVTLTFDCSDWTTDQIRRAGVMWYDEQRHQWVQIDTDMDLTNKTVSAQLVHFSQYKCDKPGHNKASW